MPGFFMRIFRVHSCQLNFSGKRRSYLSSSKPRLNRGRLQYRPEIDGLRAIAVLAVIFFHAGWGGFSGGYIGVDIFFVISGYLITSILLAELEEGRFSITRFYERRARRILPALSVVLLVTSIAAFMLMPPALLQDYARSLISVASFCSNVFFYWSSGYFSTASDEKPLLHTWSLAVEEQFYLLFPLLLAWCWFLRRRGLAWLMLGLMALSLLGSEMLLRMQAIDANFYLIFSRAWELLAGAMLALGKPEQWRVSDQLRPWLALSGLLLIVAAILGLDHHTPFPGVYAVIPVLGACLVIAFADAKQAVGKLLASRAMVGVGLISYSLYLWHQPLFAFLRLKQIHAPHPLLFALAIILALLLAAASYRWIEQPFRDRKRYDRRRIFQLSALALIGIVGIGVLGLNGQPQRFAQAELMTSIAPSPMREQCHTGGTDYLKPAQSCTYFGKDVHWASFGDSHTVELAYALAQRLQVRNDDAGLLHLSFSGCPPALLFEARQPGCSAWIRESLQYLEQHGEIQHVLLGFSYTRFLFGEMEPGSLQPSDNNPANKFNPAYSAKSAQELRELYWQSLHTMITRLQAAGKQVHLLYPIPELPADISKLVTPFSVLQNTDTAPLEQVSTLALYQSRHAYILNKLDSLNYGANLHALKTSDILCGQGHCPAVMAGQSLYFDDNHLSMTGAQRLIAGLKL